MKKKSKLMSLLFPDDILDSFDYFDYSLEKASARQREQYI